MFEGSLGWDYARPLHTQSSLMPLSSQYSLRPPLQLCTQPFSEDRAHPGWEVAHRPQSQKPALFLLWLNSACSSDAWPPSDFATLVPSNLGSRSWLLVLQASSLKFFFLPGPALWLNLCLLAFADLSVLDHGALWCRVSVHSSIIHQAGHSTGTVVLMKDADKETDQGPVPVQLTSEWTCPDLCSLSPPLHLPLQIWSSTNNFYMRTRRGFPGKIIKFKLLW